MAKIYTYSIIHSAAELFSDKVPYVVAVVEDNDLKYSTRIEGYKEGLDIKIDQEVTFSHIDDLGNRIYKF